MRIAPASSQLITAALSLGRNVRDPRLRMISSRLESRMSTMTAPPPIPPPSTPNSSSTLTPTPPAVSKKPSPPQDPRIRHKKDKKSSKEQEKSPKKSEDENKPNSRHSGRKSDKSPSKSKSAKLSPSKRSEEKKDRKLEDKKIESKVEDRFSPPLSKIPDYITKNPTKRSKVEEPIPLSRSKSPDHDIIRNPTKKSNIEQLIPPQLSKSPDCNILRSPMKSSKLEEMSSPPRSNSPDYDIVKHPIKKSKIEEPSSPPRSKTPENTNISKLKDLGGFRKLPSNDCVEEKFDYDIIRNPTKYMASDRIIPIKEQKVTIKEDPTFSTYEEQKITINEDKKKQLESIFDMPDEESVKIDPFNEELLGHMEPDVEKKFNIAIEEEEFTISNEEQKQPVQNLEQTFGLQEDSRPEAPANSEIKNHLPSSMELDTNTSNEPVLSKLSLDTSLQIPISFEFSDISEPQSPKPVALISEPEVEKSAELKRQVEIDESNTKMDSPIRDEKKARKGEKPSMMEQLIADAESHEASPSPPPPPVISDKFKEIKQSSLSRLRRVGRPREDLDGPESPEPSDVDLRPPISAPLIKDQKSKRNFLYFLVYILSSYLRSCIVHLEYIIKYLEINWSLSSQIVCVSSFPTFIYPNR